MIDALLDTSVLVDLLRGFQPAKDWFAGLGRLRLAITPVVWMETVQGATNKDKRAQAIRLLRRFRIEHPTEDDNRWAMRQLADQDFHRAISSQPVAKRSLIPQRFTDLLQHDGRKLIAAGAERVPGRRGGRSR